MDITPPPGNKLKPKTKLSQVLTSSEKKVLAVIVIAVAVIVVAGVFWFNRSQPAGPVSADPQVTQDDQEKVGELLYKQKDYAAALALAEQMVKTYPESVEMWTMKAASEFELEKYAESKASFERVLALDPGNRGANTYLVDIERFANPNSGVIRYNSNDDVDQSYVEAKLGFIPNPEIFEFYKAIQLESEAPAVEKFTASYLASEAFGGSFAAVIKSLKDTLKTAGVAYEEHPQDGLTSLTVKLTDSEGPLLGYTLSVIDQKPFELAIYYEN